jgi:predicted SprT family Zn-dependent metalloprotease
MASKTLRCFDCGKRKLRKRDSAPLTDESVFVCGACGYETTLKFIREKALGVLDDMKKRIT